MAEFTNGGPYAPLGSAASLEGMAKAYDAVAKPSLAGLALISSTTAGLGFVSLYDAVTLEAFIRGCALGVALWLITRTFWAGAWHLPELNTRKPLLIYTLVAALGFSAFATVSFMGTQHFAAGAVSEELTQNDTTDALANAGLEISAYVERIGVVRSALEQRRDQLASAAQAEKLGRGPTGSAGEGPVYNAFLASSRQYAAAGKLLADAQSAAAALSNKFGATIAEMRAVQSDEALSGKTRSAQLKTLAGTALSDMRSLLALDPVAAITAASSIIAEGVPEPSRASASSRERIDAIRQDMAAYAARLSGEANGVRAVAPEVPKLESPGQAQSILRNVWKTPGLTAAAILIDLCGWIAVFFRWVLYSALFARKEAERAKPSSQHVTVDDIVKVEDLASRLEESRRHMEALRPPAKRGRPPLAAKKGKSDE